MHTGKDISGNDNEPEFLCRNGRTKYRAKPALIQNLFPALEAAQGTSCHSTSYAPHPHVWSILIPNGWKAEWKQDPKRNTKRKEIKVHS